MTTVVYLPQAVMVDYDDTPFYNLFGQCEDPHSEIERNHKVIIENALHYVTLTWEPVNEMPPLTADDIALFCAMEILERIIKKFGL